MYGYVGTKKVPLISETSNSLTHTLFTILKTIITTHTNNAVHPQTHITVIHLSSVGERSSVWRSHCALQWTKSNSAALLLRNLNTSQTQKWGIFYHSYYSWKYINEHLYILWMLSMTTTLKGLTFHSACFLFILFFRVDDQGAHLWLQGAHVLVLDHCTNNWSC